MIRTLAFFSLLGSMALLTACSESKSTQFPKAESHITDGVKNQAPGEYRGRALDGYLQDAVVWLDMNENGQWDTFTLEVLDEDGQTRVERQFPEPHAMTSEGGQFVLDVSALNRDPLAGTDLEPSNYPLMLLAIPGRTYDESAESNVERGFFMMAPPGISVMSPFTTLVELQRRREFADAELEKNQTLADFVSGQVSDSALSVRQGLGDGFTGANLMTDYIKSSQPVMQAYGESLVALFQSQISDDVNAQLAQFDGTLEEGDEELNLLDDDGLRMISEVYFSKMANIIQQVDQLVADEGLENFTVDQVEVERTEVDERNPMVLLTETFYMNPVVTNDQDETIKEVEGSSLDGVKADEKMSAVINYRYNPAGQITQVDVDGLTSIQLEELIPLIAAGGAVGDMDVQTFPGLHLEKSTADMVDPDATSPTFEQRYTFDWAAKEIRLDSAEMGVDASGQGVLDGEPDVVFSWALDGQGRVATISKTPQPGVQVSPQSLTVMYDGTTDRVKTTELLESGELVKTRVLNPLQSCTPPSTSVGSDDRRLPDQNQTVELYDGADDGTPDSTAVNVFTTRNSEPRLVKSIFDQVFDVYSSGTDPVARVAWVFDYFDDSKDENALDPDQRMLLKQKSLAESPNGAFDCSSLPGSFSSYFAVADYSYKRLADYLRDNQ
ncbi:hypothetical protein QQM79_16790 [Marinobacteraceae bacterium S3BR75-40.1]